jgi:hypothetical protein
MHHQTKADLVLLALAFVLIATAMAIEALGFTSTVQAFFASF